MDESASTDFPVLDPVFQRFAAWCAFAVGAGGFAYAVAFVAAFAGPANLPRWRALRSC